MPEIHAASDATGPQTPSPNRRATCQRPKCAASVPLGLLDCLRFRDRLLEWRAARPPPFFQRPKCAASVPLGLLDCLRFRDRLLEWRASRPPHFCEGFSHGPPNRWEIGYIEAVGDLLRCHVRLVPDAGRENLGEKSRTHNGWRSRAIRAKRREKIAEFLTDLLGAHPELLFERVDGTEAELHDVGALAGYGDGWVLDGRHLGRLGGFAHHSDPRPVAECRCWKLRSSPRRPCRLCR